ncbi:hypothetical protein [Halorubrum depositum]|uniref:hypothetical protein n=1 Tax=Halorubrum depositum TaxID=2583992 RepID=UPI00119F4BD7|nr:hypothetical protein [Halorubrum depositum]
MDSKAHHNECKNETEQHTGCSENGLLNRRKYLSLSAAAVGAVGVGSGATAAASSGAAERNGITFDRVVNATTDLGIDDGDRVDSALGDAANEDGTLVQFPPGEYLVRSSMSVRADNFGIESTTGNREDVVFKPVSGTDPTMFRPRDDPSGFYVGSVTLDRRDEWDSSLTLMRGNFSDKVYVTDLLVNGWAPDGGEQLLIFNIVDSSGSALVDGVTRRGPSQFPAYPGTTITIFNGRGTTGDITYRNLEIHNATESGLYAGKARGATRVEDSYFKNCAHSAVRVTGNDSWVKNTTVVMDIDDLHPDAMTVDPEGIELNRGIWTQSNDVERGGPLIEDCEIIINNAGDGIAGILNHGDTGGMELRNTRIECNQDDIRPILIQDESTSKAGKPYEAVLDGVSITGPGSGKPAIEVQDRNGTTIKNSCIQMPNTDGIKFEGTSDATIEDTNVNVGGRATVFENADVTTTNLTSSDSCPAPQPDSWRNGDSSSDNDGSTDDGSTDGTSGDGSGNEDTTTDPMTSGNRIVVAQVREGEVVRYDLTASGGLTSGEYAGEEPDGNTVSGRTGSLRGVDDFYLDGYVTAFSGGSFDYANVYFADDGVDVDVDNYVLQNPEDLREVDPAVLGENVLTVESDGDQATEFEFTASGDVEPGATGDGATVTDGTVNGSTTDLAAFHFTGSVDDVAVTDPETATVTVNGTAVDGADLSTIGDSASESDAGENRIVVAQVREGEVVRYDLTASGGLTSGEYAGEEPNGNTVSGRVGSLRGVDDFYLDGYVTAFSGGSFDYANVYFADDGVDVDVDNYVLQNPEDLREVDPAVLGENVLTVESDDGRASGFEFTASGDVEPGATGDGATVTDGTVNGSTTDLAAFHFTGSVDDVAVTDPETVTVTVNGTVVDDLSTIGGEELPHTLSLVGTGSATSYRFTVSGEIEAESSPNDDIADNISSSSAEGAIETGTHVYDFSGELTDLTVTGDVEVYLDGEPIDGDSSDRHLIVFDGSNDDEVSSYKFAVSGSVESSPEHTVAADGEWDALESKIETDSAVGLVHKGKDAYWFSGYIEELELRGSAVATFETVE